MSLLAHADALDATIPTHGYTIPGSTGQLVVNPAVAEVRALRTAAMAALRAVGLTTTRGRGGAAAASAAGAALVASRWGSR